MRYEEMPDVFDVAVLNVQIQANINDVTVTLWHYQIDEETQGWSVDLEGGSQPFDTVYFDVESEAVEELKATIIRAVMRVIGVFVPFDPRLYTGIGESK